MMPFTDAAGLLGSALAMAALGLGLPGVSRLAPVRRRAVAIAIMLAASLPLGGLPLAGYLRGAIGDLSITSLALLGGFVFGPLRAVEDSQGRAQLLRLIAPVAVVFYPMTLGWGGFDPYRLGFGSYGLLTCLLALALWAVWKRWSWFAAILALAVLAWCSGWSESANLWDYLLDPLVAVYAIAAVCMQGVRRIFRRRRANLEQT